MEWITWGIIAVLAFLIIKKFLPTPGVKNISAHELAEKMKTAPKGVHYVDVRTKGEFKGRSIRGFKNIPLQMIVEGTDTLDKTEEVVLICQSGMRSGQAAARLKKQGFTNVINVLGGMNAWTGPTK